MQPASQERIHSDIALGSTPSARRLRWRLRLRQRSTTNVTAIDPPSGAQFLG
jgi:hypothetical protein